MPQLWYPHPAQVRRRVSEITRAYESCFPQQRLPNNGLGRKWARYMMRTKRLYPGPLDYLWLECWCPWMGEFERHKILRCKGHWYSGNSLGQHLEIDNAMRKELSLWTMRPNDIEWEQVQSERRERQYMKAQEKRRADGVKARRKGMAEPWKALGMSKATFYRKKLHLAHETPELPPSLYLQGGDFRVSPSEPQVATTLPTTPSEPDTPAVAVADIIQLFPQTKHPPQCSRAREDIPPLRLAA